MSQKANHIIKISPALYSEIFHGRQPAPQSLSGVCGRVIRGYNPQDFDHLTFAKDRRLAWVVGPKGMRDFIGKSGAEIVLGVGKTEEWLQEKLAEGMQWKLVVISQSSCQLADWSGLFLMIQKYYQEVSERLLRWADELQEYRLTSSINKNHTASAVKDNLYHPLHMSLERYLASDDTPQNARLFLWHSLGVNEQFTGNGYTVEPDGKRGVEEYLLPNCNLTKLSGHIIIDLSVS